jgi:hypothetical protein
MLIIIILLIHIIGRYQIHHLILFLVRVEPSLSTTLGDDSDATFKIKKAVTIIQPNFGGVLQVGSVYPVSMAKRWHF